MKRSVGVVITTEPLALSRPEMIPGHPPPALWLRKATKGNIVFVASDVELLKAAEAENLGICNPANEHEPKDDLAERDYHDSIMVRFKKEWKP